jgi:formylglycine-generating enzyme required for sulfatase activity
VSALPGPKPFVETLPGSTVTFVMRPVPIPQGDGAIRVLWFAESETTWDAYDVFYLWLDESADGQAAGREGPDAITRPTLPYTPPDRGWGHGGYPAIGVTFHAATKYCEWLSRKTGRRYRLPTRSEWLACGWNRYDLPPPLSSFVGWTAENSNATTHPARKRPPNVYGLFDTIGNVAEWCGDGTDHKPVVCGGSFESDRENISPDGQQQTRAWQASDPSLPKSKWWLRDAPFVGFRVVCEEPPR